MRAQLQASFSLPMDGWMATQILLSSSWEERAKRKITQRIPKAQKKHPELLQKGVSFKLTPDEGREGAGGDRGRQG